MLGEENDSNHERSGHGGHKALEQVGAVAGDIVDVVADKVSDDIGHAAVVLRHVVADLGKDVSGDIGCLGIVAAGHAVEHGDQGAAQRIGGNAHDAGIDTFELCDQSGAVSDMIDTAPDHQDQNQAHQAERLNAQTGDGTAAQGHFHGFTDGQCLPGTVGRADVGIGCALHAQNAHRAGHDRADQECNAACFLNKQ